MRERRARCPLEQEEKATILGHVPEPNEILRMRNILFAGEPKSGMQDLVSWGRDPEKEAVAVLTGRSGLKPLSLVPI